MSTSGGRRCITGKINWLHGLAGLCYLRFFVPFWARQKWRLQLKMSKQMPCDLCQKIFVSTQSKQSKGKHSETSNLNSTIIGRDTSSFAPDRNRTSAHSATIHATSLQHIKLHIRSTPVKNYIIVPRAIKFSFQENLSFLALMYYWISVNNSDVKGKVLCSCISSFYDLY